ncbi:MAG: GPR endopeptidase [Oscillospiraceae bacterium]|jgi:spore protease|nr:GPR endopeptidase [Oscillospiraceae bacterium]
MQRTDLALEASELAEQKTVDGVSTESETRNGLSINRIKITNENGAAVIGKPCGVYTTIEMTPFTDSSFKVDARVEAVAEELSSLLPPEGTILVIGIGNHFITPDALGPKTTESVLATRHISGEIARSAGLEGLRSVAVISPGVLGQTGIELIEIIKSLCQNLNPSAVIAIDALASRRLGRLGCTVQISDSGISPGAGVGNNRPKINEETVGVPVISIGVPTVVDAVTLMTDVAETVGLDSEVADKLQASSSPRGENMIVTPREIDLLIERSSRLIALAVNSALHPAYDPLDLISAV